jgi:hypothetical protein
MTTHMTPASMTEGIGIPDAVQTRLGPLRFFDGVPDETSTRTLFDNLDFQRAVEAYLLGLAPVDMIAMRNALLRWGPPTTTMAIWEDLVRPWFIGLIYNTSTSYIYSWLDLRDGPVVLEVPARVYGGIDDAWCRWVVDVGETGPDQGKGGKYLLVPPGYDGDAPDDCTVVRQRTYGSWLACRGFRDEHGDPHPEVERIKAEWRQYPLSQAADPPPMRFVNASPEPAVAVPPADDRFWSMLNEAVQAEPPESADPLTLGIFASVGIQHGKPFEPDARMRSILSEAVTVGDATARALTYRFRQQEAYYYPDSAWRTGFLGGYQFQEDGTTLLDTAAQVYFIGGATDPGMAAKIVGRGSEYAVTSLDAEGRQFDGARSYQLHVPPNVPVNNFWSVLVYDTQTRSMLQTDQEWPSVTSQDDELVRNADGSVDVYFGPEPPEEPGNWIQTVAGKSWFTIFRLYGPLEAWFDRTWRLPEIESAPR